MLVRKFKACVVALFLAGSFAANAQIINCQKPVAADSVAFGVGETLRYSVAYNASIIDTDIVGVSITTSSSTSNGTDCYKVEVLGKTYPFYDTFFALTDSYTTWIDKLTLKPLSASSSLQEGEYRYSTSMLFNWANKTVATTAKNAKSESVTRETLRLEPCSMEAISLFFRLRCANFDKVAFGTSQRLSLVLEDTVRSIRLRYMGKEVKRINGVGRFNTVRFVCQFATSNDQSFRDGAEFTVWVSDDLNHVPLYFESPIKVGRVYGSLKSWSSLKHPLTSLIKAE